MAEDLDIIGPGNGLSLVWHQAIPWTNGYLLSIEPFGAMFNKL